MSKIFLLAIKIIEIISPFSTLGQDSPIIKSLKTTPECMVVFTIKGPLIPFYIHVQTTCKIKYRPYP